MDQDLMKTLNILEGIQKVERKAESSKPSRKRKQKEAACTICKKVYKNKYIMYCHLKQIHNIDPHECKHCQATFTNIKLLREHIEESHLKYNQTSSLGNLQTSLSRLFQDQQNQLDNNNNLKNICKQLSNQQNELIQQKQSDNNNNQQTTKSNNQQKRKQENDQKELVKQEFEINAKKICKQEEDIIEFDTKELSHDLGSQMTHCNSTTQFDSHDVSQSLDEIQVKKEQEDIKVKQEESEQQQQSKRQLDFQQQQNFEHFNNIICSNSIYQNLLQNSLNFNFNNNNINDSNLKAPKGFRPTILQRPQ